MYFSWSKALVFLVLVFFIAKNTQGQTSISGIINDYASVSAVDVPCNSVTVSSVTNLSVGDKILIIQMKGATVLETNSAVYGNLNIPSDINNAGNYEFNEILGFIGTTVYLKFTMAKAYTVAGVVQLIRVPQYVNASVDGILRAQAWNGSTGGVLVFEASGTITLNADIDVSELGFIGGAKSLDGGDCTFFSALTPAYAYAVSTSGAGKGEGATTTVLAGGRGKRLNGGGGGGNHNCGGGGGANYGNGGNGGNKSSGCYSGYTNYPGIGGLGFSTTYSNAANKIFMGGAGGGGHQNNSFGLDGGNGGGIIIINALNIINSGTFKVKANGKYLTIFNPSDNGDGSGGGGAGGTILLNSPTYNSLVVEAIGGKGGDTYYPARNFGPGGGGGGGLVWVSNPVFPNIADLNASVNAGAHGVSTGITPTEAWGSQDGVIGAKLTGLTIPKSSTIFGPLCVPLPVDLIVFSGKEFNSSILLNLSTSSETNNNYFILEKSIDGIHYDFLAKIDGHGNSAFIISYSYNDTAPSVGLNYYRLKQYDYNGTEHFLGNIKVRYVGSDAIIGKIYPNPVTDELIIETTLVLKSALRTVKIINLIGEEISMPPIQTESNFLKLDLSALAKGVYFIQVSTEEGAEVRKIVKE